MTIQQIQNLLQYLGYYTITVDGIWGQGSEQATKDFQAAEGLEVDGIPGKLTQAALLDQLDHKDLKDYKEYKAKWVLLELMVLLLLLRLAR